MGDNTVATELIERVDEQRQLGAALDAAESGAGSAIVVTGAAGVGKSSLLRTAGSLARARPGWTVFTASGDTVGRDVTQLVLRQWFASPARASDAGAEPFDGPGALVRELVLSANPAGAPSANVAYATTWVVSGLAATGPVLLVVDDLHWVDAASQAVVEHLANRIADECVVLVVAARDGEPTTPVDLLTRIRTIADARALAPQPLSEAGVAHLTRGTGADAAEVHRATGGVPFLVTELLAWRADGRSGIPTRVADSVTSRLARLGPDAEAIADAVVTLGTDARLTDVAAVADVDLARAVGVVDDLVGAQLLADSVEPLRTVHPLVAEAIVTALGPARTAELHARCADVLAREGADEQVVAAHLLHAPASDDAATAALLHRVADAALRQGSTELASALLDRALAERGVPDAERVGILASSGRARLLSGDADGATQRWRAGADIASDVATRAALLTDVAEAHVAAGRFQEADAGFAAALAAADEAGLPAHASERRTVVARAGVAHLILHASNAEIEGYDEVLAGTSPLLRQAPAADTAADRMLMAALSSLLVFRGESAQLAGDIAERSLGGVRLLDEHTVDGPMTYVSTGALNWTERYAVGIAFLDEAVARARRDGSVLGHATAIYCRGYTIWRTGDITRASADIDAALAARADGWSTYLEPCIEVAVELRLATGDVAGALELVAQLPDKAWSSFIGPYADFARGLVARTTGDFAAARDHFLATGRGGGATPTPPAVLAWREQYAAALVDMGSLDEARVLADDAVRQAARFGAPRAHGNAVLVQAAATTDPAERTQLLRDAVALLESGNGAYDRARGWVELGRQLASDGRADDAAQLLTAGYEYARGQDARPLQERSAQELRTLGRPVHSGGASRVRLLSPGERRVCELAARGLTNRQVAAELFVTVKAVEWHLSRAFPKLGITSRRELPALFGA